jgi:lysozyme
MSFRGIDVSHHNGNPDWGVVAGNGHIGFAIAKATEGLTYTDPSFARNWTAIKDAGIVRGAYHFARPSNNTAEDEADHFMNKVDAAGGIQAGDLLALDMEDTHAAGDQHDWTLTWLQRVEAAVGFKPLFYSGRWYMDPHGLTGMDDLTSYPLWYSSYNYTFGTVPNAPSNWNGVTIHQYSDKGTVPGITGNAVDLDYFGGSSADDLRQYGCPGSSEAAPPSTYTVKPEDTWESIADQFGVNVGDLMAANPNIDQLEIDMIISLPTMAMA